MKKIEIIREACRLIIAIAWVLIALDLLFGWGAIGKILDSIEEMNKTVKEIAEITSNLGQ